MKADVAVPVAGILGQLLELNQSNTGTAVCRVKSKDETSVEELGVAYSATAADDSARARRC